MRRSITLAGIEFDLYLTLLVVLATILPMLDYYGHRITGTKAYDRVVLYFLVPLAVILLLFRERPAAYGLRLGRWRTGLKWSLLACAGMAVILWFVARTPAMQQYYQEHAPENVLRLLYITAVDLLGWEFIWRGLLLFGLARVFGPGPAILLQAVPFAFMHLGKPEVETLSTLFGGTALGLVAWRSESFLYPFLIHWFIASFTQLVALGKLG